MGLIMTMIMLIMLMTMTMLIMMPLIMVMPMQSSYQPHLYRDRTRTKVLWRTLSFTLSRVSLVTLSRISPGTLFNVSSVIYCKVTLSGVLKSVAIISPISPYFLQRFTSLTLSKFPIYINLILLENTLESLRLNIVCEALLDRLDCWSLVSMNLSYSFFCGFD